jgi:hypothetical protein
VGPARARKALFVRASAESREPERSLGCSARGQRPKHRRTCPQHAGHHGKARLRVEGDAPPLTVRVQASQRSFKKEGDR